MLRPQEHALNLLCQMVPDDLVDLEWSCPVPHDLDTMKAMTYALFTMVIWRAPCPVAMTLKPSTASPTIPTRTLHLSMTCNGSSLATTSDRMSRPSRWWFCASKSSS